MINEIVKKSAFTSSWAGACSWCQLCREAAPLQAALSLGAHTQFNQSASTNPKRVRSPGAVTPALPAAPRRARAGGSLRRAFSSRSSLSFKPNPRPVPAGEGVGGCGSWREVEAPRGAGLPAGPRHPSAAAAGSAGVAARWGCGSGGPCPDRGGRGRATRGARGGVEGLGNAVTSGRKGLRRLRRPPP